MAALADREASKAVGETYQFLVGDSAFYFRIDDGSIELHDGRAVDPAVTWATDEETWADVASGKITASSATATGNLTISGEPQAAKRLRKIFSRRAPRGSGGVPLSLGANYGSRSVGRRGYRHGRQAGVSPLDLRLVLVVGWSRLLQAADGPVASDRRPRWCDIRPRDSCAR